MPNLRLDEPAVVEVVVHMTAPCCAGLAQDSSTTPDQRLPARGSGPVPAAMVFVEGRSHRLAADGKIRVRELA
jgi:hypothetical protein